VQRAFHILIAKISKITISISSLPFENYQVRKNLKANVSLKSKSLSTPNPKPQTPNSEKTKSL
jgi:hypothetical protein